MFIIGDIPDEGSDARDPVNENHSFAQISSVMEYDRKGDTDIDSDWEPSAIRTQMKPIM